MWLRVYEIYDFNDINYSSNKSKMKNPKGILKVAFSDLTLKSNLKILLL
jgi:hypothetical protein